MWAIIGAGLHAVGWPLADATLILSLLADVGTAFLIVRLLRVADVSPWGAVTGGLMFLTTFDALSLARSGMETSLFTFLVTATLVALAARRGSVAGLATGLACLTRPEAVLLVPIGVVALAWRREGDTPFARAEWWRLPIVALAVVGPWIACAWWVYGSPIPQSVVAKAAGADAPGLAAFSWVNLRLFLTEGQYGGAVFERSLWSLQWLRTVLALAGVWLAWRAGVRAWLTLAAFPMLLMAALALSHAFTWFPWYYGPFHAALAWLAALAIDRLRTSRWPAIAPLLVGALVVAQAGVAWGVKLPADRDFWVTGYQQVTAPLIADGASASTMTIAAPEIGVVGWTAWPARVLDLVGLVSPVVVGRDVVDVLRDVRPDHLIVRTDDAAPLLERLAAEEWFVSDYVLSTWVADPFVPREFRVYSRTQ